MSSWLRDTVLYHLATGDPSESVVAVHAGDQPIEMTLRIPEMRGGRLVDLLEPGTPGYAVEDGAVSLPIPPRWGRVLRRA